MSVKQLSVFIDNKPGRLAVVTKLLARNNVDMRALSLADTADYGILRILAPDVEKIQALLSAEQYISKINHVLAVSVDDTPGGLSNVVSLLGEHGINIEYLYAFVLPSSKKACVVLRVEDTKGAEAMFNEHGVPLLSEKELNEI